jgi:anti-anti-sigma factor
MKDVRIQRESRSDVEILRLTGALDMYTFPRLEAVIGSCFSENHPRIIIDCANLDYIGSAGLGALVGFAKQAREKQGDVKLLHVPQRIFKIIELLGFTKVLTVHPSEADALAGFHADKSS